MNPFFIPIYQLYLLQLENYEIFRYWRLLFLKGYLFPNEPLRKSIVWTQKALGIFVLAVLCYVGSLAIVLFSTSALFALAYLIIGFFLFPVFYTLALFILLPFDTLIKFIVITQAKQLLSSSKHAKVIALAGSYGKTTMKNVISYVLSTKFNVITTPESVNTPIGVAQWFLKNFKQTTDIVIVEMGEHYRGDIAYLCSITPPDVAVLTGINEAHLERLQTLETSIATMFEIVEHAKEHATIILNADDEHIRNNFKKYGNEKQISFYSSLNNPLAELKIAKKAFDEKQLHWSCTIETFGSVIISLLGEYTIGDVIAAIFIGKTLGMSIDDMKKGIASLSPIPHRLEPIEGKGGVLVIDDSYNGNPDGAQEAIRVLSRFKNRRKIFITPGLVEMGDKAVSVHEEIGRALADVADCVILIKNSVTPYIEKGLKEKKFDESKIIWFNTAIDAHASLSNIIKENDVVFFQNDWGDQYI
ncbi:UDP-N-acetylmuramoyl-tripeptide--D-alanyl-D-alanine ligase [Patescibacteria group bacterium]|nr:UDP-N-acetylmuramoyl-tripeptide--D-alanyl-D-alanine ligase [Patescibacteria group bacterium]